MCRTDLAPEFAPTQRWGISRCLATWAFSAGDVAHPRTDRALNARAARRPEGDRTASARSAVARQNRVMKRLLGVTAWVFGGLVLAGLGAYLFKIGLDRADKFASAAGLFVVLVGLAVDVYGVFLSRRKGESSSAQVITGSTVGNDVFQVKDAKKAVRIKLGGSEPIPRKPAPEGSRRSSPPPLGEQVIADSSVGGSTSQIEGVGGDVEIDR
jgi:hypothetical protein